MKKLRLLFLSISILTLFLVYQMSLISPDAGIRSPWVALQDPFHRFLRGLSSDWTIPGIVVVGVIFLIFLNRLRHLKGSLYLEMPTKSYRMRETVSGTLVLKARQAIDCREITLRIRCFNSPASSRSRDKNASVLYEEVRSLQGATHILPGSLKRIPFEIILPERIKSPLSRLEEHFGEATGTLGAFARGAIKFTAQFVVNQYDWEIEARVVARGIDLQTTRKLSVLNPS